MFLNDVNNFGYCNVLCHMCSIIVHMHVGYISWGAGANMDPDG